MPKKTSILIIILAITTGILIFLAVRNENLRRIVEEVPKDQGPTAVPTIAPYATLAFSAQSLDLSTADSKSESVDVVIDTQGKPVFGAQIELEYDPEVISDIEITNPAGSFFGDNAFVLINEIDEELGRITYAVSLPAQDDEKTGEGVVARISFTASDNATGTSAISFLPKTTVTSLQTSSTVLSQTKPLSIVLSGN